MAIGNHNDLTHIVRTSDQWKNTYDKYELIPTGVLCVELVSSDVTKIKIGDGHNIFSKLPYIGDLDLSKYYTKLETDTRIKEILTQEKVVRIKGLIGSKSDLPADARCGDIYFVRQLSSSDNKYIEYIYSPDNTWEPLGGIPVDIDLSEYAKTVYVDDKIEQVNERIDDIEQHGTHTHPNKEILDQITEPYTTADKETLASLHNYDDTEIREMISQSSHTHANKDILDATSAAFTKEDKSKLDQLNPYDDSILKEKITELERVAHEHSNKRILDQTTASFTKEYERKMRWIRMYTGCTGMEEGIAGLVPAAQAGEEDYVLSGSGEWVPQTGGGGTYTLPIATASTLGGIKVGNGLEIDANGVLSTTGGGGGGDSIAEGGGITITTDPQTGVKTISVDAGNGLQINQDGEVEIDPSIIPEVPDYRAGDAIEIEHNEYHLSLTDYSNNDFIASIILSATNGSISKAADNSSFVLSSSYDDCYTRGSNYGSNGSYPYMVKPLTQYRLQWDSASPGVTGYTMIFENGEYTYVHVGDQGTVSYIDFTTAETTTFIQVRFGIAYAGNSISISNVRLYEYIEDAFEYDEINVKYNKGLVVNQDNELEVVLSDGLQFDSTASETMVADEMYLFDSRVTCQVYGYWQSSSKEYRTFTKLNPEPALCCLWEVGSGGSLWTGPLFVGLTATSVQYSSDIQASVSYQNTFNYLGKTWYTSGYPDFLSDADHEDKLGHLQYLGSYAALTDQIQAAKDLIDLANVRFVSNAGIQAKLGNGLQFDSNDAIEVNTGNGLQINQDGELEIDPSIIPDSYDAGNGIEITEVTHEDEFRVQNQEYFFTDHGLTCIITGNYGPRTYTKINDGDIVAAVIGTTGGWYMPLFVGLTEDSVKYSNSYDSNILGPDGSFTHHDKTWYYTANYALTAGDGVDHAGHLQSMTDTIYDESAEGKIQAAKDLIDLAVLLPDVSTPTISAKIGAGLSFDANGAIQADAQPLSPATDSTLGGVIVGDGILVDADGTISVDPTIIPEITEYEGGTAISIEDVEHGGVTFDAWDSGTGWENVCYYDSTGNSVVSYRYEAHSSISNSYTLPAGATHIRAIAYDQNDTMLWTSFSWIDSNNYHFASTSPEDGHYDDWFDIPTGAVKVNFGVRHSKLNTTTAMSLNDIKSVDITVQTVSEIEVDVWNGGTGWLNGDYGSGTSNDFYTNWYYTYHYNYQQYIEVPEGATHVMVQGVSNDNDSHFEGGGCNVFDSNHNHVHWFGCAWQWHELSSDVKYVQPNVKWDDANSRTISGSDVKSVTLVWKLPALEINQAINVKYGNGLTVNQNNELEVNLGSGLSFDANGAIEVVGGGGGDTIAEGDGITITTDSQTGIKTIGINVGDGLEIDPLTNELFVNGQLPEGTIIKKLTYVGTGAASIDIQFTKKPIAILNIYGDGLDGNRVSTTSAPIDSPTLNMTYGKGTSGAGVVSCNMSYNDTTNILTLSGGVDEGARCNKSGSTYTMFYLTKGHTGSGTSVNNEVSIVKIFSYTGTGTTINNIQFPETPDYILNISGPLGSVGDIITEPIDIQHPTTTSTYIFHWTQNGSGLTGRGLYSFNDSTNVLTLDGRDYGATLNYADNVYYVRYVVNEIIASSNYVEGDGIEIDPVTGEISVNIGSGLAFDPQTGAINVTGGGGGSGDTVAEGAGIEITTDQQTGNKVIAVNAGSGLQVNQTTNELEVSSGVVTSIAPTQNTPGSITVTDGGGTATPVSVIGQLGGATSSAAGTAGYAPAPASGDDDAYLRGDGTWDDSVVTEDDELTLVFVPDDYQPS